MLNLEAKRSCTLAAGKSGSGKTTFLLRYLVGDKGLAVRFLFDAEGEFAQRLQIPACETPEELTFALEDGWVIYDPHTMFPGDLEKAFDFFCNWAFAASEGNPGRKALLVDEVWKYCSPGSIPKPLATCIQTGRKRLLEMCFATQRPNRLNEAITNEVTELVCFALQGENALRRMESFGLDLNEIRALPLGHFVDLNVDSGRETRGRLW